MKNVTEKINELLKNEKFTEQLSNAKTPDEIKKLFADNNVALSDEDVNGFLKEVQTRASNLSEKELNEIAGGKCAIGTIAEGVGDIGKGVGRGVGYALGGVARGVGSLAYNTTKGVGKIAWGTLKIPTNVVVQTGKGFWKGLTK